MQDKNGPSRLIRATAAGTAGDAVTQAPPGLGETSPDGATERLEPRLRRTAAELLADFAANGLVAVPAAMMLALAFQGGGFFPGTSALAAVQAALVAAAAVALAHRPLAGINRRVVVVGGALALFVVWTALSARWTLSDSGATFSYDRVLIYLLLFVAFATLTRTERRMQRLVYSIAAAIVVVCGAALVSRTLPDVLSVDAGRDPRRLSYPVGYWNALGILAGIGLILCTHLACSVRESRFARALGAGAVPVLAVTLLYTLSRGAVWATAAGLCVYLIVARPRGIVSALLTALPASAIALAVADPVSRLTQNPTAPATIDLGRQTAITIAACAVGAGLFRAVLLPLDSWIDARITPRMSRAARIAVPTACALALVGAFAFGGAAGLLSEKWDEFNRTAVSGGTTSARLLKTGNNGRIGHWRVAMESYRAHPARGDGAGSYAIVWKEKRKNTVQVHNAHSLYVETLGELGWPGLVLLVVAIGGILTGFAVRARGPERPLYAALLGAGVAWALAAGFDWIWQIPAVTLWLFAAGGLALAAPASEDAPRAVRARTWLRYPIAAGCAALAIAPFHVLQSEAHLTRARDAYRAKNCSAAIAEARASIAEMSTRGDAYQVVVACELERRAPEAAIATLSGALAKDPNNWQLWYDVAVARGRAGLDPRAAARRANQLNPQEIRTHEAVTTLSGKSPRRWKAVANRMPVLF